MCLLPKSFISDLNSHTEVSIRPKMRALQLLRKKKEKKLKLHNKQRSFLSTQPEKPLNRTVKGRLVFFFFKSGY